jgi:catechol 2,3-dioxygenase-like lactoylglutathione lyase family enzyme
MNVKRICFLGTRTGNFDATASLFRDVLGLEGVRAEAGWSIFQLPSGRGDFIEVFGGDHANTKVFPAEVSEGTVVGFAVDDIVGARQELAAAEVGVRRRTRLGRRAVRQPEHGRVRLVFLPWARRERLRHATGRPPRLNLNSRPNALSAQHRRLRRRSGMSHEHGDT